MTLTALAQGGSGRYRYRWACYALASSEGIRELGAGRSAQVATVTGDATASSVELENGYYVVLVNVKDLATGAFKHHQQQVFASPFPAPSVDVVA